MTGDDFEAACRRIIEDACLGSADGVMEIWPLTGGVSSDIAAVRIGTGTYCVKRALHKLKVAADWRAPIGRNAAEYHWLAFAGQAVPGSAPRTLGRSEQAHGFVMEFLPPEKAINWKTQLLGGGSALGTCDQVGKTLARLHAASTMPDFDAAPFDNLNDFDALRLDPYLRQIGRVHANFASAMEAMCVSFAEAPPVLVHGDISPKNILVAANGPVLVDAECATMGDGAFDVAFCLNHLLLKAVHQPELAQDRLEAARRLWSAYQPLITWEPAGALERRIAQLLPALLLARVDGKSPVEYLNEDNQHRVRAIAMPMIERPPDRLEQIIAAVHRKIKP